MKELDIMALRMLVSAIEEKSLSKAAESNNTVISAASKRISALENYLGKALLVRHGRGVTPTPAGLLLYQRAKGILRGVDLAKHAVESFTSEGMSRIRLAANPSAILQFLPKPMSQFLKRRNDVSIDLLESQSLEIPRMVIDGLADIGIYHSERPATGVVSYPYKKDRIGLVVPIGHPLEAKKELYLEEALDYQLLGYFPRHSLEQFLQYTGNSLSRPPTVKLYVLGFEARCQMIREGAGISIIPEQIAQAYLSRMGLVLLRLRDDWATRQFYLCMRKPSESGESDLAIAELMQFLL